MSGNVAPGTSRFELIGFDLPAAGEGKSDGEVTIAVRIGEAEHKNALSFRAFSLPQATKHAVVAIDPAGLTTKVLRSISTEVTAWNAGDAKPLIVVGRQAMDENRRRSHNWRSKSPAARRQSSSPNRRSCCRVTSDSACRRSCRGGSSRSATRTR